MSDSLSSASTVAASASGANPWPNYYQTIKVRSQSIVVDHRGRECQQQPSSSCSVYTYPRNGEAFEESGRDMIGVQQTAAAFSEAEQNLFERFVAAVPSAWRALPAVKRALFAQKRETTELAIAIAAAYRQHGSRIYPPRNCVFRALVLTAPECVRVVIVGQDPYIFGNQADGLAFSTPRGNKIPPSLINILSEMGVQQPQRGGSGGDLTWLAQSGGVLLLNTALTVQHGKPNSHRAPRVDWERFTDAIIAAVSQLGSATNGGGICFMLWGAAAKRKRSLIANAARHLILTTTHPSPKSAKLGFIGCDHFARCDQWLDEQSSAPVFKRFVAQRCID